MSKPRLTHRISRAALILVFALFSATTAWASVITLDENTGEVTLQNGDVLTGTGGINTNVKIADGATVTLSGVHITAYYNTNSNKRPGITCLGDAVIVMAEGTTNNVKGGNENPGIRVPADKTLTLQGSGTLNATGGWRAAGIGSGSESSCGTVIISAGTVTATGGGSGAGIGSGRKSSCGNITINGGIVNATGGNMGAGIGSGYAYSSCGTVTISGGIVNANGGEGAVGIGSGYSYSTCGNITITNNVIMVTATKGGYSPNTIGAGYGSSCGTVTIGGVTGSITQSPYTYIPNLVTLTPQSGEVTLQNGAVLTGTGGENTRVKIAAGATVVLFNVNITAIPDDNSHGWAGITCLGDAVIVLYQGTANDVKGGKFGSSIFVPQGHTLTLQGSGTLNATGGSFAAGIGSGLASTCGNIILSGGIINATGGSSCAGIGSGYWNASCESITITNGVTMVTATAGQDCDNAIGAGDVSSTCGTITIGGVETGFITESPFTTYPYTVSFDANGGSGTMANMGFMYGVAQNLTANSFTNWGHSFDGWTTSANGPKVYDDGQSVSNLAETSGATVTLYAKWITDISVSGDEYTIHTPTGWDDFCDLLANNSNGYFTGKTVKLDADISVTRMAGGSGHEFTGTFDGQGHTLTVSYQNNNGTVRTAPFSYVNGATIQNLVVAGDITGTASRAAGIVGETGNSLSHVTNCVSSVNISGGSYTGGISVGGNVEITGCVFNGTITGTNMSGGFVGYSNSVLVISDCLFAPQEGSSIVGGTFYYNGGGEITPVNSYYTEPLGTPQGIHAITFAAATPAGEAINTYSVSGLTTYANGMQYGDTFYINPDMNFSVDGDEYTIHTATGWEMFCDSLANNGNGFFTGKTVKLADNISVTRMAGGSDHEFTGTFNGQGYTLTVSYQNNNGAVRTAPFSYVNGATIQNLIVAGDITGTASRAAGIMGETGNSLSHVTNCVSSVNVSGGSYTGGISVGGKVEITGCVFNGTIVGTNMSGGFVGYSNSALVISDCLFAPQEGSSIVGGTFYYNGGGEITPVNSYYTVLLGTEQGHPAVSDPTIQPAGNPTATYNVSNITTYANGMLYGETFYYNMTYIGSGDGTSAYLPLNNYYKYSLTEQIYTAEELGEAGIIERIGFFKNSNKPCNRDIVIYMVHTDKSEFDTISDWIPVTEADRVFSGTVSFDDYSWTDITLDEVFVYDGLHNVVIVVDDNSGSYNSTTYFSTYSTGEVGQALYQYSDGTNFDLTGTLVASRDVLYQKNLLRILKSEFADCMKPSRLIATEVAPTFVVLDWTEYGASENWLVSYDGTFVEANDRPFTITGLEPETEYTIAVSPICDTSLWSRPLTLTTLVACPAPFNVEVNDITYNSANVTWTGYSDSYTVFYRTAPVIVQTLLNVGFEGGVMPDGWYVEGDTQDTTKTWRVGVGDSQSSTGTHSGDYNALIIHASNGNVTYLVTPAMNLSGQSNLKLSFWYINRIWSGDIDGFAVCYREGEDGDWIELWSTIENHQTWTFKSINLTGLPDNCQIGFRMMDGYGRGVGLDDILIGAEQIGEWEEITTLAGYLPFALTNLEVDTEYEVYVTADCYDVAVSDTVSFTTLFAMTKDIVGYGTGAGGYHLIASPVAEAFAPSANNGFITNEYDLYYFDHDSVNNEWQNYKVNAFNIESGMGYLYASQENTKLIFPGTPNTATEPVEMALAYNPDAPDFGGWNLVGNPFAVTAFVDRDFYTINAEGTEIVASTSGTVEAMEGIFVVADAEDDTVTFSTTDPDDAKGQIVLNLSQGRGTIDRAIVRFDEGGLLPKFQLDPSHTKVYIPQDGKDYAIVNATDMGEMPVNFKAEHNGTYTLTFSSENVDFNYLHLIDNLTGADVDLLTPPAFGHPRSEGDLPLCKGGRGDSNTQTSYTFEAKTTDYASRFKLVFSICGDANGDNAPFAFINNGNIVINGEGTLQVIDVMGRVVVSVGGHTRCVPTAGMPAGVYVLRLIDGDVVRTQKIVVR